MNQPIQIKQMSLSEASKQFNIPIRQLRNAVDKKLLKHFIHGKQTRTTNVAVMKYLEKLLDGLDIAPERPNYDINKFKEIDRPVFDMKEKLKNL